MLRNIIISSGSSPIPEYTGTYTVIPTVITQSFETNGKKMLNNFTVNAIPYSEVENEYGGKTITIAG